MSWHMAFYDNNDMYVLWARHVIWLLSDPINQFDPRDEWDATRRYLLIIKPHTCVALQPYD